jgi:hypothetical protein
VPELPEKDISNDKAPTWKSGNYIGMHTIGSTSYNNIVWAQFISPHRRNLLVMTSFEAFMDTQEI